MMRIAPLLLLSCFLAWACNNSKNSVKLPQSIVVDVRVQDTTTIDTLRLYAWQDIQAKEIRKVATQKTETGFSAKFELGKTPRGMYYIGTSLRDLKPFLLGTEKLVVFEGKTGKINKLSPITSDLNKAYEKLVQRMKNDNQQFMTLVADYNATKGDEARQAEIKKQMATEDSKKKALLDSLKGANSELARIMAFNAYQSYQNNGISGQVEGTYFAEKFFEFVDFNDSVYARLPFYYENIKNYTTALSQLGLKAPEQNKAIDSLFAKVSEDNKLYKPTLVAVMFGVMGRNNPMFVKYGKIYVGKYKGEYPTLDKFINSQLVKLKGAAGVGEEAANITGKTPEGKTMDLKSLRGKYVLIDFWASWCGPCRRENPNVVRLYKKYKDKGFDILGVSLDNNKQKWIEAIAKDGLAWHHISDLKGWSSELSKPYGVRGIPYTVLLDKEGKIIAQRLRAHTLEAKLKEIFGS